MQDTRKQHIQTDLDLIAQELIDLVLSGDLGIREGVVMTTGTPPYRRLDCDGRALAYVRARPRRRAVRVDVSGLWVIGEAPRCGGRGAGGGITLLLRCRSDLIAASQYLEQTVRATRQAYDAERAVEGIRARR